MELFRLRDKKDLLSLKAVKKAYTYKYINKKEGGHDGI
jgi:hypothetical protein